MRLVNSLKFSFFQNKYELQSLVAIINKSLKNGNLNESTIYNHKKCFGKSTGGGRRRRTVLGE